MTIPLETERLIFRDWKAADVEPFQALCADPRVMQFVGDGEPWPLDRTEQFVVQAREMSQTLGFCQWPVIHKTNSAMIGFCGFVPANAGAGAEIGWRLATEYWGQGLATEAARAVLKHGFETLGFQRVIATVQTPNRASIRIVEKLGMKPESSFLKNGRTVILYSIDHPSRCRPKSAGGDLGVVRRQDLNRRL